ncbi:MAG: PQQ-dependent sugar dehydrogenase [Chloroflexi bacterium]|nr:PQQ-dependent sugar dehydrogenase [Chloroflexota bacterium]
MKRVMIFFALMLSACATPTPMRAPTRAPTIAPTIAPTRVDTPLPTIQPTNQPTLPSSPNVEIFAKGLDTPWAIDFAPDGRAFFTERLGAIRVIKDGKLQAEPWMKIAVSEVSEAGLLGLVLDPQFARNRFVYVAYTTREGGRIVNRLVRLREENDKGAFDKILIDNVSAANNHDGGRVKFGPDGKVYWTMGDAQNTSLAQDLGSLNGKILRLNSDGTIPNDNPFPNSYVYSYGHRNPQGLAWQPGTNRLYAAEHGPSGGGASCCRDELNLIEPGKNYGWSLITGDQTREGLVAPVIHSGNDYTWAPSGIAFATRGAWAGSLLITGLRGEALYRVSLDKNDPRKATSIERLFERKYGRLRDVIEGPDGALYILTSNADGRGNVGADGDVILRVVFK